VRLTWLRGAIALALLAGAVALVVWRGPELSLVRDVFGAVAWRWVVAAVALNLLSVGVRTLAWRTVIDQAMPPPHPGIGPIFSAFSIGLLGNAALPGRVGEVARVAVLARGRRRLWPTLAGTVVAHRVLDLVAMALLVLWVLSAAEMPRWAVTTLIALVGAGVAALGIGVASARRHHLAVPDELGPLRRLLTMARHGLGVLRAPASSAVALFLQCCGWGLQLFAVWAAMFAFRIDEPLAAAGLVLVLMNVAGIFPLWPGNVGLVQAAVALPLVAYGIQYAHGFAFGIGLQAIEASVGIGLGLLFLAREGLTLAMLGRIPEEEPEIEEVPDRAERARVPV
jgi:uncharacterized membrane protein YbhN (UPF0104 family)